MDLRLFSRQTTPDESMETRKRTIIFDLDGYVLKLYLRKEESDFQSLRFLVGEETVLEFEDSTTFMIGDSGTHRLKKVPWRQETMVDLLNLEGMRERINSSQQGRRRVQLVNWDAQGEVFLIVVDENMHVRPIYPTTDPKV